MLELNVSLFLLYALHRLYCALYRIPLNSFDKLYMSCDRICPRRPEQSPWHSFAFAFSRTLQIASPTRPVYRTGDE